MEILSFLDRRLCWVPLWRKMNESIIICPHSFLSSPWSWWANLTITWKKLNDLVAAVVRQVSGISLFVINGKLYGMEQRRRHFQASKWPQDASLSMEIWTRNEMSWILFHDLGSRYWFLTNLSKPSRMHQLEETTIPEQWTHFHSIASVRSGTGKIEEMTLIFYPQAS